MRHLFECPLRWGDMDLLGHVNNVVHLDYLREARGDLLRRLGPGTFADGLLVRRHEVGYRAPLIFAFRPVCVEIWVVELGADSLTLAYEVFQPAPEDGRTVYLRATSEVTAYDAASRGSRSLTAVEREALASYVEPIEPRMAAPITASHQDKVGHYPVSVRESDLDRRGEVTDVKVFEYLQEARLLLFGRLWREIPRDEPRVSLVVAQTDVDYLAPMPARPEPYDCWSWIARVGTTSMSVESEIRDGATVRARARVVVVFFDEASQRATPPPAAYRDPLVAAAKR